MREAPTPKVRAAEAVSSGAVTRLRALLVSLATVSLALVAPRLVGVTLAAETGTGRVVVRPADHGRALVNPGMGFVLHHYDNSLVQYGSRLAPSDPLDDFPGLSTVYLRLAWSYVEPEEGRFDWSIVDTPRSAGSRGERRSPCASPRPKAIPASARRSG